MEYSVIHKLIIDRVWVIDELADVLNGFVSSSSTIRKIALACWSFSSYKGMNVSGIDQLLNKCCYIEGSTQYFTYDVVIKEERSYFQERKITKSVKGSKDGQVVMYFVPHKHSSEGRLYKMKVSDLERIVFEERWSALPDPKCCYCWTQANPYSSTAVPGMNGVNNVSVNVSIEGSNSSPKLMRFNQLRRSVSNQFRGAKRESLSPYWTFKMPNKYEDRSQMKRTIFVQCQTIKPHFGIKLKSINDGPSKLN